MLSNKGFLILFYGYECANLRGAAVTHGMLLPYEKIGLVYTSSSSCNNGLIHESRNLKGATAP